MKEFLDLLTNALELREKLRSAGQGIASDYEAYYLQSTYDELVETEALLLAKLRELTTRKAKGD